MTPTLNWRTVLMALPRRRFTAAELQRAVPEPPSLSLKLAVLCNVVPACGVMLWVQGAHSPLSFNVLVVLVAVAFLVGLSWGWRDPSHRGPHLLYYALPLLLGLALGVMARLVPGVERGAILGTGVLVALGTLGLWFTIVYRHKYVEMRLAELDEREHAADMARQLAAAQIQPHFLFNSLASLQHWVHTKDDRAAPLLDALTAFLRATLPLFNRRSLRLGDEAEAVRQYLEVMRLRLGARLRPTVEVDAAAAEVQVPPGLLLTLAENAVEHGVMASLGGADVCLRARWEGGCTQPRTHARIVVEVQDSGPGPAPDAHEGVGLSNCRERLRQAFGADARITLSGAPGGGALARIEFTPHPSDTLTPT
jgi:hypothetical protein